MVQDDIFPLHPIEGKVLTTDDVLEELMSLENL
jgi:hypothetical protein